jgi:hypothetical protein
LLKLIFERGGFYDRAKELNWKSIEDMGKLIFYHRFFSSGFSGLLDPAFMYVLFETRQNLVFSFV